MKCDHCGGELTGQQRRWCSPTCRYEGTKKETVRAYSNWKDGNPGKCEHCGGALTGRQMKWCSLSCKRDRESQLAVVNGVETLTRKCRTCGLRKPLAVDFYPAPHGGYRYECRACTMAGNKERDAQPDASDKKRDQHLRGLYGITVDQYEEMLQAQGGKCAVCGKPPITKRLAVDHDHATGLIRGLLCNYCNLRIVGKIRDSRLYRSAADYLDDPPAQKVIGLHAVPRRAPRKRKSRRRKAA